MSNFAQWSSALDKQFDEKVVQRFVQKHRTIALQAFKDIAIDSRTVAFAHGSPVWTGRFKGSNTMSIGAPDFSQALPPHPEAEAWPNEPDVPYPSPSLAEAAGRLTALKPFEKVFIANALPYARRIESGHSAKAPEGVYNVTSERIHMRFSNTPL